MGAQSATGTGPGSAEGKLRGYTLDDMHKVLKANSPAASVNKTGGPANKHVQFRNGLEIRVVESSVTIIYVTFEDHLIVVTSEDATTVNLPDPRGCSGEEYVIKRANTSTAALTLKSEGFLVDGLAEWSTTNQAVGMHVVSDGTQWLIASWYYGTWGEDVCSYDDLDEASSDITPGPEDGETLLSGHPQLIRAMTNLDPPTEDGHHSFCHRLCVFECAQHNGTTYVLGAPTYILKTNVGAENAAEGGAFREEFDGSPSGTLLNTAPYWWSYAECGGYELETVGDFELTNAEELRVYEKVSTALGANLPAAGEWHTLILLFKRSRHTDVMEDSDSYLRLMKCWVTEEQVSE